MDSAHSHRMDKSTKLKLALAIIGAIAGLILVNSNYFKALFMQFETSAQPFKSGAIECVAKNGRTTHFNTSDKIVLTRDGFLARGEGIFKVDNQILKESEDWACTDSSGTTQELFQK